MTVPKTTRRVIGGCFALVVLLLSACSRTNIPQDPLNPAGRSAHREAGLFWGVFWIAVVVFVLVEGLLVFVLVRFRHRAGRGVPKQVHGNKRLEIGWTVAPALLLLFVAVPTVGTIFSLSRKPVGALEITVTGHQWWWEVAYPGTKVVTANEIHIPTGRPVYVRLESKDVIHSFWIPRLAGKQDLEPGDIRYLNIQTNRPGVYLGQCAEYCGISHANMRMRVFADPPARFRAWLAEQAAASRQPSSSLVAQGQQLFEKGTSGGVQCTACHTTQPGVGGTVGPNLAHFGSRTTFAGSIFISNELNLRHWLENPQGSKPGNDMTIGPGGEPGRSALTDQEIRALIAYLESLK
jgi:cytochrome c oxidase subunit 2